MVEKQKAKKSKGKQVFDVVVGALTTVVLVFALLTFAVVLFARTSDGTPRVFGYTFSIVATDSMTPEINVGDLVIAKEVENTEIEVGDDIVFISENPEYKGMHIVHRVVAINSDGSFQTQGVKAGAPIDEYSAHDVLGKVVGVSTAGGKFLGFLVNGKSYIFLAVLVLILILMFGEVANIVHISKEKKQTAQIQTEAPKISESEKAEMVEKLKEEMLAEMRKQNGIGEVELKKTDNAESETDEVELNKTDNIENKIEKNVVKNDNDKSRK